MEFWNLLHVFEGNAPLPRWNVDGGHYSRSFLVLDTLKVPEDPECGHFLPFAVSLWHLWAEVVHSGCIVFYYCEHFYFSRWTRQLLPVPRGFVSWRFHLFIFDNPHLTGMLSLAGSRTWSRPGSLMNVPRCGDFNHNVWMYIVCFTQWI